MVLTKRAVNGNLKVMQNENFLQLYPNFIVSCFVPEGLNANSLTFSLKILYALKQIEGWKAEEWPSSREG